MARTYMQKRGDPQRFACLCCGHNHDAAADCPDLYREPVTLAERCERCGYRHGDGPCLKPRVIPMDEGSDDQAKAKPLKFGRGKK